LDFGASKQADVKNNGVIDLDPLWSGKRTAITPQSLGMRLDFLGELP
jgi:hypothetical protein